MTWDDIPGWFDFASAYEDAAAELPGGTLVEVGCYLGRSLVYLAGAARRSGKPFRVVGVDWCRGSGVENGHDNHADALARGEGTLAGQLHRNLIACGVSDVAAVLVADSRRAADLFPDGSLAMVFLDAGHDYESVKADIAAWLPKVRPGGWLGGDDYCDVWPGVKRAVAELLPGAAPWSHDSWRWVKPA